MSKYNFTLKETDGKEVSLDDYKGQNVLLYFYPKDNTPGWKNEATGFKDLYDQFKELNTVILGVSRDNLRSHAKFRDKLDLPFLLLSDDEGEVHKLFDVVQPKKLYGKEYIGVERSTFIFNKKGDLVKEFRNVKVKGHAEDVLEYIKSE